jgi:hypothetical protein
MAFLRETPRIFRPALCCPRGRKLCGPSSVVVHRLRVKRGRVPDRYRIRIWVLSNQELAQLRGDKGDRYLLDFRNVISACIGLNVQDGATVPNGTAAFGVRAPDIDDGGELEHGNHQIHPTIMSCDPSNLSGPGLPPHRSNPAVPGLAPHLN